ncbi:MAG: hypothetical protein ACOY5C_02725 [Pseudomonadota bacterium]
MVNDRTAKKAAIDRASAEARKSMNKFDAEIIGTLTDIYEQAAEDVQAQIEGCADADGTLRLDVLQDLLSQIQGRLKQLEGARNTLLEKGLVDAATLGVAPFSGTIPGSAAVADEAVRFVRNFVAEDGLQLSDRLWRLDRHARDLIGRAVESAVIQGHSASKAAQDFLARGVPVPADIVAKLDMANAGKVSRIAGQALTKGEGNPYANALRVFRTEINRAHLEAYRAGAFQDPEVIGTKFMLSPNHRVRDICDMHASVNRYGLGPGVYPRGKSPLPAHPNTHSYEVVVYADEISDADRAGKTDRIAWLREQPAEVQEAVLGSRGKRALLARGDLKESEINTPWKVLRKKHELDTA